MCATLHLDRRVRGKQQVLPTSFQLYETDLKAPMEGKRRPVIILVQRPTIYEDASEAHHNHLAKVN